MDVKTAFLNAMMEQDPEEDVLLIKPPSIFLDKSYRRRTQCICHSKPSMAFEGPQGCGATTKMER